MFINQLPEDCLLIIFGLINELDDLLNCYKVCSKWSHLIEERTRKVKYLIEHQDWRNGGKSPSYSFDHLYYRTKEPIDSTCLSALFPNLMIADFSQVFRKKVKREDMVTLVKKMKPLKGLIHRFYNRDESLFQYCDHLEMVSTDDIDPFIQKNGLHIKQLHLKCCYDPDYFKENAHHFPNLERLHICYKGGHSEDYYHGPILKRLEIVELSLPSHIGQSIYYGFQFMDSCPSLKSAHIRLRQHRLFVDESLKHESLQDLVFEFYPYDYMDNFNWNEWKSLFRKYSNLKHLAMVGNKRLENEHVEQLVRILPNLVLFAVRGCPGVTQKAADYIQDYNKLYGRSIKFYFDENQHEIGPDWPQLSTKCEKISQGFDFMKHCFLKRFRYLSTFLIPYD